MLTNESYKCKEEVCIAAKLANCNKDKRRCFYEEEKEKAINKFIENIPGGFIDCKTLIQKLNEVSKQNNEPLPDWVWFVLNSIRREKRNGNIKKNDGTNK